jgi:hypothetical protein
MAVSQTQFDPDLQKQVTDVATLVSLVNQLVAALKSAQAPDDLTAEDASVNASDASVQAAIAAAQAALNPPTPPTGG